MVTVADKTEVTLPVLDLISVRRRVWDEHSQEWTRERIEKAVQRYLAFWQHCKEHPHDRLDPDNHDVDVIWHAHILHTKRYADDCQAYFGHFLHHTPVEHEFQGMIMDTYDNGCLGTWRSA